MSENKYTVELVEYKDLTPDEDCYLSENGRGKEYASYIRIKHDGETFALYSDAMEPEDARFSRDLSWIIDALQTAFELGKKENSNERE